MSEMTSETKELNVFSRIAAIFTSPRAAFVSVNAKPSWLLPFVIMTVVIVISQYLILDISIDDRLAIMEAHDATVEQLNMVASQSEGFMKYIGLAGAPIGMLIYWAVLAGVFVFAGNTVAGGDARYKNVFAMVSWGSLIGIVGSVVGTYLILSKGTTHGVTTSLAILLPVPELGASKPLLYRLLSHADLFAIWQAVVWIHGFQVMFKFDPRKAATVVLTLWGIWIVVSVTLGGLLSGIPGM